MQKIPSTAHLCNNALDFLWSKTKGLREKELRIARGKQKRET
jgi:hypothetical protein